MKKIIMLGLVLTFLVTGCNDKKIVHCAYYEKLDDSKITYDYLLTYDKNGEKIKTMTITNLFSFSNKSEKNMDKANSICDKYKLEVEDLVKCVVKQKDNDVEVTVEIDVESLSKEQLKKIMDFNLDLSYEELKSDYESQGYQQKFCVFDSKEKLEPVLYELNNSNDLSDVKPSLSKESIYGILNAAENFYMTYMLENMGDIPGEVDFVCDGKKCATEINGKIKELEFRGTVPTSGSIYLSYDGEASIKDYLVINGYTCAMNNDDVVCEK